MSVDAFLDGLGGEARDAMRALVARAYERGFREGLSAAGASAEDVRAPTVAIAAASPPQVPVTSEAAGAPIALPVAPAEPDGGGVNWSEKEGDGGEDEPAEADAPRPIMVHATIATLMRRIERETGRADFRYAWRKSESEIFQRLATASQIPATVSPELRVETSQVLAAEDSISPTASAKSGAHALPQGPTPEPEMRRCRASSPQLGYQTTDLNELQYFQCFGNFLSVGGRFYFATYVRRGIETSQPTEEHARRVSCAAARGWLTLQVGGGLR